MPPVGERLASLEVGLSRVQSDVGEIKLDVKKLLAAHNRDVGRRAQRELSRKQIAVIASIAAVVINVVLRFV